MDTRLDEQIIEAIKTGDSAKVKNLLAEKLIDAAAYGDLAKVKSLLDKGADVNAAPRDGWTALMSAASERHWAKGVVLGGYPEKITLVPAGNSPSDGRSDVVELLIERGADINAKNKEGRTPLMEAAENRHEVVARILLSHGAEVNARDKSGKTALTRAVWSGAMVWPSCFSTNMLTLIVVQITALLH